MKQMLTQLSSLLTRQEKRNAAVLLLLMLVGAGIEVVALGAVPGFVTLLSDPGRLLRIQVVRTAFGAVGANTPEQRVLWASFALIVVYVVKNAYLAAFTYLQAVYVFNRFIRLSHRVFKSYLLSPHTFHLQRNTAELLYTATEETSRVVFEILLPLLRIAMEVLVLVAVLGFMVSLEPLVSMAMLAVVGGASVMFLRAIRRKSSELGGREGHYRALMIKAVQQGLGATKELKILGREQAFVDSYLRNARGVAEVGRYRILIFEAPRLFLETITVIAIPAVATFLVLQGRPMSAVVPVLSMLAVAALRLAPSANRLVGAVLSLGWGRAALAKVHADVQRFPGMDTLAVPPAQPLAFSDCIQFDKVRFRYEGSDSDALRGVTLRIPKGRMIGFVGTSGAGKSTAADVLLGLLTPSAGRVLVDGVDIHGREASWQRNIGYVPQAIYLTDDTLRANIALGIPGPDINEDALAGAIEAAQLAELVRSLPRGLETTVGEHGVRLSGGQRQRIGIARALYHDPAVLVLDEATSALDNETERGVVAAVEQLRGTRTIIVIAHRMTTVERCDEIIEFSAGHATAVVPAEYFATLDARAKVR